MPQRIGRLWGGINAVSIREDMEKHFLAPARQYGIATAELLDRGRTFVDLCRSLAPHWLDECAAAALAAGVDADLYTVFVGSVYRSLFLGPECTSYSVAPEATAENRIFFHKTRDNVSRPQTAFILTSSVPGINKFIAVSDASVIACMMMLNDKGLAGSADTGGMSVESPRFRGMMNTHVLRYVAEHAATCAEALEIVRDFVRNAWYAGGAKTGTHWHFVDAAGRRLEISCNSTRVTHVYHSGKVYFSARANERCAERLREADEPIDFATFRNVSRDSSMCFDSSIAGMTVEIHPEHPDRLSCAWISMPARGLGFPLFIGGVKTPLPLLNGEADAFFRKQPAPVERWEQIEAVRLGAQRRLEKNVAKRIAVEPPARVSATLDAWARRGAAENLALVFSPGIHE